MNTAVTLLIIPHLTKETLKRESQKEKKNFKKMIAI